MSSEASRQGSAGDVAIDLDRACLRRGEREIRLRAKTFQVLIYLQEHHGRLVTKEELFRAVWPDTFVTDDSLTKCIGEIRDALGDRDHRLLKTVARRGFILDAPLATVQRDGAGPASPGAPSEYRAHNLPVPLTSFIGRQRELVGLAEVLPSTRLLTLTGIGGCGKTRLALEAARQALDGFPDGVWFADLSPLAEPALVPHSVASVLDVRQAPARSMVETLSDRLRPRRMLLVLDNCEHVITAAADLAGTLLRAAPGLTILATSREALGVPGERTWQVRPLGLPDPHRPAAAGELAQYEAVQLLVERAAAVDAGFTITAENAGTVAEVCRRLDGIPLAIELAAARLKVLSIEQIHARLDDRFRLLARVDRTPGRQRTLEAAVDWSYELLVDGERQLLRRLSAFVGGWTLEGAEHVCAGGGIAGEDVLDLMSRLVDKSLVMVDADVEGRRRYRYLEAVRQYAWERLGESGEADAVRARHFEFFLELARRAEPELTKAEQLRWLDHLHLEHDNLRAALEWQLASDHPGPDGLELAARLHWLWLKRAHIAEGQRWLERALARSHAASPARRAQALLALGSLVFMQGDFERAQSLLEESVALARSTGEHSIAALALGVRLLAAAEHGDAAGAARLAADAGAAARRSGIPWLECFSLSYEAYEALHAGDVDRAGELHEKVLALLRGQGEIWSMGIALFDLALLRVVQQRPAEARALCGEAIALGRRLGDQRTIAWCLGVLAGADAVEGRAARAARLRGAMESVLDRIGAPVQPTYNTWIGDRCFGAVQEALGTRGYEQALAEGGAMSLSQALELTADS